MDREIFEVKRERFHLLNPSLYILQGNWPKEYELEAWLDNTRLDGTIEDWENTSALERFSDLDLKRGRKVTVTLKLPFLRDSDLKLTIFAVKGAKRIKWFQIPAKELKKRQGKPFFYIEEEKVNTADHSTSLRGWIVSEDPVRMKLFDDSGCEIPCKIQWNNRMDVVEMFKETSVEPKCGFFVELRDLKTKVVYLVFHTRKSTAVYPVEQRKPIIIKNKIVRYAGKGQRYFHTHGAAALLSKTTGKLLSLRKPPVVYSKWLPKHLPDSEELKGQRKTVFSYMPKISIVVPLYKTPEDYLLQMVESVKAQTYSNWELCLSDGSGALSPIADLLSKLQDSDERIVVIRHEEPRKIAANTNAAIRQASGAYIAFMDHDDVLTPNALFENVKLLNEHPGYQLIYSDEDKMSMDGHKFFQPHFKPDFNLDLLCTVNYICHFLLVSRALVDRVGMLREEYDGAQDYDFIFRCIEEAKEKGTGHIAKILYHWRSHEDSTSENPESKLYAFDAGERAVQAHYDRIGVKARVKKGEYLGLYRTRFILEQEPLVSIIIPNKDHIDDLKRCMDSIVSKSSYKNYEFIIIENNSTDARTFEYYKELEGTCKNVKVVYYKGHFNYSKINNFGVQFAKGDYLLLLNNDTEVINGDWLEEMVGYCSRREVGIVGARLYYEDDTIQHAGVVIGFGGIAGHCFVQQPRGLTGYCHRIICAQDYSAVTAACMMVKKSVFEAAGGFTEELEVAFNDVDFCLKVRKLGYLVVYNPYAELYHYESKSRGLEDTPEKIERFHREIKRFESAWPEIMRDGDPYYNPNLTLDSQDFSLRRI